MSELKTWVADHNRFWRWGAGSVNEFLYDDINIEVYRRDDYPTIVINPNRRKPKSYIRDTVPLPLWWEFA